MSNLNDNQWIERVEEIKQMVSDVNDAPVHSDDVDYYINEVFCLTDSDEIRVARAEFERLYPLSHQYPTAH